MEESVNLDLAADVLDEIALEGLDGITITSLFLRLQKRPRFLYIIDEYTKPHIWNTITKLQDLKFYTLPQQRKDFLLSDDLVHESKVYAICPVKTNRQGEYGSCQYYEERKDVTSEVRNQSLEEAEKIYGQTMVLVASQEARLKALCGDVVSPDHRKITENHPLSYILLESIGRARRRGLPTSGPASAQSVTKDPRTLYYHYQHLLEDGIIRKYVQGPVSLLVLKRYKLEEKDHRSILVKALLRQPHFTMPRDTVMSDILGCTKTQLKKLLSNKIFERVVLPCSEMFPDVESIHPKKRVVGVRLTDPERAKGMVKKEENEEELSPTASAPEENRDMRMGISLIKQCYLAVLESRDKGVTCKDLHEKLLCGDKAITMVLKKLFKSKSVNEVREQVGRQKKIRATLVESEWKKPVVKERLEQLELDRKPIEQQVVKFEDGGSDTPEVVISDVVNEVKAVLSEETVQQECERKLWRMGLVLRVIKQRRVISKFELIKYIAAEEKKQGYKETIDRRSVGRIADKLAEDGIIQIISPESTVYYADPTFDPEKLLSKPLDSESITPAMNFENDLEQMLMTSQAVFSAYIAQEESDKIKKTELLPLSAKMYVSPKFLRISILHDLMFYMARGYDGDNSLGQEQMLERLKENSDLPDDYYEDLPTLYKDRINPYMFIPPLPGAEKTPGWLALVQMLMYTPLSMYLKLVRVQKVSAELSAYLSHPIKCNYPLFVLPPQVRIGLLAHSNMVRILADTRRLCFMGLVRFGCHGLYKQKFMWSVYVNSRASVLDTTKSAPGSTKVEKGREYPTTNFFFQSVMDAKNYWIKLFNVCLETKLGHNRESTEMKEMVREFSKDGLLPYLKAVSHAEALELDTGAIPGDNLGAAGLDSALFSYLRYNWFSGKKRGPEPKRSKKPKPSMKFKKLRIMQKKKKLEKKKSLLDDSDLEAIASNRQRMRVIWSSREDNILILCRVASDLLSNLGHRRIVCINREDVRTALRRHIGTEVKDKTQYAVARRIALLGRGRRWVSVINNLKQAPELQQFVESRPARGSGPTQTPEYFAQMKALFHQMVDYMAEHFLNHGLIIPVQTLAFPDSIDAFNKLYELTPAEKPLSLKYIQEDSIRAVLLSSLSSVVDRTSQTSQLFEVYRQYDDVLLKNALDRLHKQRVVTTRRYFETRKQEKPRNNTKGAYQFSQRFKFMMNTKFHQSVYYSAYLELNRLLCCRTDSTADVNLASSSPALFSLSSSSHVTLTVTVPEQFIQIDHSCIPPHISKKIIARYRERQEEGFKNDISEKTLDDDEDDGQPPAKRALYDFDESVLGTSSVAIEEISTPGNSQKDNDNAVDDSQDPLHIGMDANKAPIGVASTRVALMLLREIAKNITEEHSKRQTRRPFDIFAVSSSKVLCTCSPRLSRDYGVSNVKAVRQIILKISESHKMNTQRSDAGPLLESIFKSCREDERLILERVVNLLEKKKVVGATLTELRGLGSGVAPVVRKLEKCRLAIRLGTSVTHIVARQYATDWAIKSFKMTRLAREKMKPSDITMSDMINAEALLGHLNDSQTMMEHDAQLMAVSSNEGEGTTSVRIIMRPWLRVDGSVNRRILDRMLGSVLGRIMTLPGSSIAAIADRFSPALTPVWIRELVDLLHKLGCITLTAAIKKVSTSLFTQSSIVITEELDGLETEDELHVEPTVDAIVKLGQFIGNKSYSKDILLLNDGEDEVD